MATHTVEFAEAKASLARLVELVSDGDEVVITRNGRPIARIVAAPPETAGDRTPGSARNLFSVPDDFDAPLDEFGESM